VLAALAVALSLPPATGAARVVAIGDIHGAYQPLVDILGAAGLVDDRLAWSGGDATLVQLGDFTDRGPRVRAVMDLLMRLQQEAPAAGGRVIVLLGNHEALNLVGELRDTNEATFLEFAADGSEGDREEEYRAVVRSARLRARLTGAPRPVFDDAAREAWMRAHPAGALAYLRALRPDGLYGEWLRQLPTVAEVDGVLFLHGGIDPDRGVGSAEEINAQVRDEVARLDACRAALGEQEYLTLSSTSTDLLRAGFALLDELRADREADRLSAERSKLLATLEQCVDYENWHLFSPDGPLWFRGYAEPQARPGSESYGWTEEEGGPRLARVLTEQGVDHVVVAHSPQKNAAIGVRFGGRAFLIDTGMLAEVYGGKPSALELDGGAFTAIYPGRREEVWNDSRQAALDGEGVALARIETGASQPKTPWRWLGADGKPLPFRGPEELEDFLRTAEMVSHETIDAGINRPTKMLLERDGVRAHAVFRTVAVEERGKQGPHGRFYRLFRDNHAFECAAYELANALGLGRVPPAVPRVLMNKEGSLQAWVENAMTEGKRIETGRNPPDALRWARVQLEKQVFDALINNHDRNAGNELIDGDWNVWLIDHTRAFETEYGDDAIEVLRRITPELWSALRSVERARVRTVLQPFLRANELEALFDRWDRILLRFRTMIAEQGPENVIVTF
jgi:hypothetical protein